MTITNTSEGFEYWFKATVIRVVDGDTIEMNFDLGRRIFQNDSIRLYRINAPELSTPEGVLAKKYLQKILPIGTEVIVQTHKNKNEKYGRWLGDVYLGDEGFCVNDLMVEGGHAVYKDY